MQIWEWIVLVWLAAANITGFAVCAADKRAAKRGVWRVRESTLFVLALIGGSVGVWLAILLFRHKTRKLKFTVLIPLICIVQAAAVLWAFL